MGIRMSRRSMVGGTGALAAGLVAGGALAAPRSTHVQEFTLQDETIEVTGIRFIYGNPAPNDGPGLKAINEKFHFDYKPQLIPVATYLEKLSTQVAGGDIPDIIVFQVNDSNFYKWAGQNAFLDLTDLVTDSAYKTFSYVREEQWNLGRVNDGLFAIPQYYPPYALSPSIRQDWLDNLGLAVPTTYEEFAAVARAFTEGDPTGTGERTYGVAMGENVNPFYAQGSFWEFSTWYHKDDQGRFVPGFVTEHVQSHIAMLADLFANKALTQDFAVMDWATVNNEFYGNKAGIFIGAPRGMSQDYYAGLKELAPEAHCVPIPPFKAPDGSQHFTASIQAGALTAFSAKLQGNDDKIKRILAFMDYQRTFYPQGQDDPRSNPDVAWNMGGEGTGWDVVEGTPTTKEVAGEPKGLAPSSYFMEVTPFPPTADAIDYQLQYKQQPEQGVWAGELQQLWTDFPPYIDPSFGITSATMQAKGNELITFLTDEITKMIAGQRGLDTWGEMVEEWRAKGGEQVIEETNAGIQERDGA